MTTVGFVGLGNMGGPMAESARRWHVGKVFDLVPELIEGFAGAQGCASAEAAAADVDVFVSMLPAGQHVRGLYLGRDGAPGLLENMSTDTLVIDCSTIDPDSARAVSSAAAERGIAMLDAPVSGGTAGAVNGTLTFIVGGARTLEAAQPVLDAMAPTSFMPVPQVPVKSQKSATTCCYRFSWPELPRRWLWVWLMVWMRGCFLKS